jgi:hypothetical protein
MRRDRQALRVRALRGFEAALALALLASGCDDAAPQGSPTQDAEARGESQPVAASAPVDRRRAEEPARGGDEPAGRSADAGAARAAAPGMSAPPSAAEAPAKPAGAPANTGDAPVKAPPAQTPPTTMEPQKPAKSSLPCAVNRALVANCQSCHGLKPIGGAPMALVEPADFQKQAVTKPDLTVHALALMRMNDKAAPMPPGGIIAPLESKSLTDWLSAGAPAAGEGDEVCDGGDAMPVVEEPGKGLTPRPGEVCYELLNHGAQRAGDTSPFMVAQGESYEEFIHKVPWPPGSVATRFGSRLDNLSVLHHWLMFTSPLDESYDGSHSTTIGTQIGNEAELVAGWALGGRNVEFPADVGLRLPDEGMINVQWHFNNHGETAAPDASTVQVCTVPVATRSNTLSMTWLGTEDVLSGIPPHQVSEFSGTCRSRSEAPITVWALWPHMHLIGRSQTTVVERANGTLEPVFHKPFDFNKQVHYELEPPVVLQRGDKIKVTCTYENTNDNTVYLGETSADEMCYQFAMAYPAGALNNGAFSLTGAINTCWGD